MAETIFEALQTSAAAAPGNAFICIPRGTSYAPDGFEWTYADVMQRVLKLAKRFEQAGYGPGHRVALLLETGRTFSSTCLRSMPWGPASYLLTPTTGMRSCATR